MLFKDGVGIERCLGVDHFLISDLFLVALGLGLPLSRFAISAGRGLQLGNLPSSFQRGAHIANSVVAGLSLFGKLPIALRRISLQQCCDYLASLVRAEMSAVNVGADDVVASSSIIASEV